ncbi:hypothetical protein OAD60_04050 [Candidatus Thioglobus sp.]|jgi:hypothetical protein|uniref:hypothetical protein n=1 Tax=Candidatus Pseudothioglobus sp. Uisw_050_01 TaxID=3230997 RepID=UPI00233D56C7|nr:hypothetical protein [Candidatus Thioglobus sp.]MDB9933441.1 hypothetical protein [Candidatus Thioglobus sp.]MDB9951390.1 hypothetical protein [Candidatus Thioglobus sp.]
MSKNSVIDKLKDLRKDLDKESKFLQEQMELPLNGDEMKNSRSDNNSMQLNKGVMFSKWVRKLTTQFESVDPFYK